eukprot:8701821-Lingulodinium_polyedra.AAC.1
MQILARRTPRHKRRTALILRPLWDAQNLKTPAHALPGSRGVPIYRTQPLNGTLVKLRTTLAWPSPAPARAARACAQNFARATVRP